MELQNSKIVNYALNNGDSINPQVLDTLASEANGGGNVQADWAEINPKAPGYIANKPQLIRLFDTTYHKIMGKPSNLVSSASLYDLIRVNLPYVYVGGAYNFVPSGSGSGAGVAESGSSIGLVIGVKLVTGSKDIIHIYYIDPIRGLTHDSFDDSALRQI